MKTKTAHNIGIISMCFMLTLPLTLYIQPPAVAKTIQYASISEMQQKELKKLERHHQAQCGHDDWLCLLAYADVTRGVK